MTIKNQTIINICTLKLDLRYNLTVIEYNNKWNYPFSTWIILHAGLHSGLVLFFLLYSLLAFSSNDSLFKPPHNQEYLPSNFINYITQRHDGFIWIATAEGVSRFDGENFINHESFPDDLNSLPNPWVNYLLEDHNNQLWVATEGGLARLLPDEMSFEQYRHSPTDDNSLSGNSIPHLFEDDQSRLWISTYRGLSLYQSEHNNFKNFYISGNKKDIKTNSINSVAQKNEQQLWVGTDFGLFIFDIKSEKFTRFKLNKNSSTPFEVMDLDKDSKGALWVVTAYSGLQKVSADTQEVTFYKHRADNPNSIASDGLWSVSVDRNDNVWVASWGEGISKISATGDQINRYKHNRGDQSSIPSNLTMDIFQDSSGLIWIATYDGITLYDPNKSIAHLRPVPGDEHSLSSDLVWAFEETNDAIWIGTTEGINQWDKKTEKLTRYYTSEDAHSGNYFTSIWDMASAGENTLWLGTEFGLAQFNTQTKKLNYLHELNNPKYNKDSIDLFKKSAWVISKNDDQSIWVGTSSANLYLVDKELNLIEDYTPLIYKNLAETDNVEFTGIIEDANKNLWLCTTVGMFFFDRGNETILPVKSNKNEVYYENDWVFAVEKHQDNQYWISSQYGGLSLHQLNPDGTMDRLLHFDNSHNNINDRSTYTVMPIDEKTVWFTSQRNLYKINLTNNNVTNYGDSFFDLGLTFHENTQFYSSTNQLYLGSNKGVIKFDPNKIKKSKHQPKIYFTGIKSNSKSVATKLVDPKLEANKSNLIREISTVPVQKIYNHVFDYHDTVFHFQFAALDYLHAEHINYAYRIPELDDKWVDLSNHNELTLTNLHPGNYHLQIKATNADLQWSQHMATLDFTLLPKTWLTWWAKLLYLMVILAIAYVVFRLYRSRLLAQYALRHREVQLSQAIWGSGDELWEWDVVKKEVTRTNSAQLNTRKRRYFNGSFDNNTLEIHPDDVQQLNHKVSQILDGSNDEFDAVYRQKNSQGSWVWIQDRAKVTGWSNDHKPLVINGISRNINAIKKKEEKSQLIASAFQSSSDGAIILDDTLTIVSINAAFTEITGFNEHIISKTLHHDFGGLSPETMKSIKLFEQIISTVKAHGSFRKEIFIERVDGQALPIDLRVNEIFNKQVESTHYVATFTDITFHKQSEKALKKLANYDSLTGLSNRSMMMSQLNNALLFAQQQNKKLAILFFDLDHFKNINDSLGHSIGDRLLIAVANRLTECAKAADSVARIGGDEFTIGLLDYDNQSEVIELAERVLHKMASPFELDNYELIISTSIGIATFDGNKNTDVETMLMQADTAMYHAKENGRNNFQFFTASMNESVLQRMDTEMRLRKALQNNELFLHFQPKFNLSTEKISGLEALLRWKGPDNNLTPPDEFIHVAEETGLIFVIGEFVLEQACQELSRWHSMGFTDLCVAVNISAVQFMDNKLVGQVSRMIEKYNIKPLALEIEITETTLIDNLNYTVKTLNALQKLGVKLSLDDFGTGFSSLNYLKQFPINTLKIDRSFILDMVNNKRDASMVESIVLMAHKLSIDVVAEGVETEQQLAMLSTFQVEEVQGFLLSKPLSPNKIAQVLVQETSISSLLKSTD